MLDTATAKRRAIDAIAAGCRIEEAMASVDRKPKTYQNWLDSDPNFKKAIFDIRHARSDAKRRGQEPDEASMGFVEFREKFFHSRTYPHQQNIIDLLEGRQPSWLHDSMVYSESNPEKLLINLPPDHAKSTTITIEWVTYQICMNPNIRVIIISKTRAFAQQFLHSIKQRLTSHLFAPLQAAFGGTNGFRSKEASWTANQIYLSDDLRDSTQKDPTVQTLGIGGQIYGARADIVILDDVVVNTNAGEYEKQIRWIESEVDSRLPAVGGKLVIIGTRMAPVDLYSEIVNPDRYTFGDPPYTVLRMPAVLEFGPDSKKWTTLWPRSSERWPNQPDEPDANGEYPRWDGPALEKKRATRSPATWSLVFQQQDVVDNATFPMVCISGCMDGRRRPGPLEAGALGHPRVGQEGHRVIGSMDPAMAGDTFALVGSVDRDGHRWVHDAWLQTSPTPAWIRDTIKTATERHGVQEWVIESNAFQLFLVHDEELNAWLATRGVRLIPHYTGSNKQDPDFGVASMAPLFGSAYKTNEGAGRDVFRADSNLIHLPRVTESEALKALVTQLTTWEPGKRGSKLKQDGPMALWFWELRAREFLGLGKKKKQMFVDNPYLSAADRAKRSVMSFLGGARG